MLIIHPCVQSIHLLHMLRRFGVSLHDLHSQRFIRTASVLLVSPV